MVRRRIWLMATVAAFLTLQTPLCALACLESPGEAQPPCHEGASSPGGAPPSHDDCEGCNLGSAALLQAPDPHSEAPTPPPAALIAFSRGIDPGGCPASAISADTDLPPPDILLRKSTLLI